MDMDYDPSQLPNIDAVEVVELKGILPNRVSEYMREAINAPTIRIDGEAAQHIAHLWRQLPPGEQMRCHMPHFGLRFYAGGNLLLQASLCWDCNNIFINQGELDLYFNFNGQHPLSRELLALLKKTVS